LKTLHSTPYDVLNNHLADLINFETEVKEWLEKYDYPNQDVFGASEIKTTKETLSYIQSQIETFTKALRELQ